MPWHSFGFVFLRRSLAFDLCLLGVSLLGHVDCPLHKLPHALRLDVGAARR